MYLLCTACSLCINVLFYQRILNQCIKLFSHVSGGVFGLCEFDCSVINVWNVRLIMTWDLESHSTHSQTIKPSSTGLKCTCVPGK